MYKRILKIGISLTLVSVLAALVASSLFYQYDLDELFHIQIIYLLLKGYHPYSDFFLLYTHVFHIILSPIFYFTKLNFGSILFARFFMIFMLFIRFILLFVIVKNVFSFKTAVITLVFQIMNPMESFYGAQIRPDAVSVTLLLAGIYIYINGNKFSYELSGIVLGSAVLVMLKILPSLTIFSLSVCSMLFIKRDIKKLVNFLCGLITPIAFYTLYFLVRGELFKMLQNVTRDAVLMLASQQYPARIWFYFQPNNDVLFGSLGKPLLWYFPYICIGLVLVGIFVLLLDTNKNYSIQNIKIKRFHLIFLSMLITQWVWLFTLRSVFGQYFLTVGWLMSIFSALGCVYAERFFKRMLPNGILMSISFLFVISFGFASIKTSIHRLRFSIFDSEKQFNQTQSKVPKTALTFPNFLFHPFAYPITYGTFIGDVPKEIMQRLGSVSDALEQKKVTYLLLSPYTIQFLDQNTQKYIKEHYHIRDDGVYIRNEVAFIK